MSQRHPCPAFFDSVTTFGIRMASGVGYGCSMGIRKWVQRMCICIMIPVSSSRVEARNAVVLLSRDARVSSIHNPHILYELRVI